MYRQQMTIATFIFVCMSACGPKLGTGQLGVSESDRYSQASPYATLASINKAISDKRFDYIVAHLADQTALDAMNEAQVKRAVRDTKARYGGSGDEYGARMLPQLKAALRACQLLCPPGADASQCMKIKGDAAECILKDDAKLEFVRKDGRWFMKD